MPFWKDIEADLKWRETELATLKILCEACKTPTQKRAMLRSMLAMLYAHFEGFCKNTLVQLAKAITKEGYPTKNHIRPIIITSIGPELKKTRSLEIDPWVDFIESNFIALMNGPLQIEEKEFASSNLHPSVLKELCSKLGVAIDELDQNQNLIRSLVGRRNDIAHGQSSDVKDIKDYNNLEDAAIKVMYALALAAEEFYRLRAYLSASSTLPTVPSP